MQKDPPNEKGPVGGGPPSRLSGLGKSTPMIPPRPQARQCHLTEKGSTRRFGAKKDGEGASKRKSHSKVQG